MPTRDTKVISARLPIKLIEEFDQWRRFKGHAWNRSEAIERGIYQVMGKKWDQDWRSGR